MATTATSTKKWFVLRAVSGKEKKVKEMIDAGHQRPQGCERHTRAVER